MGNTKTKFSAPAWLRLTLICLVSAISLAATNMLTKDIIAQRASDLAGAAIASLVPEANSFEVQTLEADSALKSLIHAKKDGQTIAYAGTIDKAGYAGPIEIITATDTEGKILGISVGGSEFAETVGLGSKAKDEAFTSQFVGLNAPVTISSEGGDNTIDAIAGATITTRAVLAGVNETVGLMTGQEIDLSTTVSNASTDTSANDESKEEVIQALVPNATSFEEVTLANGAPLKQHLLAKNGENTLAQVGLIEKTGFIAPIEILVAVQEDGSILGISVGGSAFAETENLGALAKEPAFTEQFKGLFGTVTIGDGGVDVIAGATITTKAVVDGVNEVLAYFASQGTGSSENTSNENMSSETTSTESPATKSSTVINESSLKSLVPEASSFEAVELSAKTGLKSHYIAKDGDTILAQIGAIDKTGFIAPIEILVAVNKEGTIANISVGGKEFAETENLGALAKESAFTDQFKGLSNTVTIGDGSIDVIAGATITTKAVVDGVNEVLAYFASQGTGSSENTSNENTSSEATSTESPATKGSAVINESSLKSLVPEASSFEAVKLSTESSLKSYYIAKDGDTTLAQIGAIEKTGFIGPIEILVAVQEDGNILAISVGGDKFDETANLGALAKEAAFTDQFKDLSGKVAIGEGGVDVIAGATITTKAVVDGVNEVLAYITAQK